MSVRVCITLSYSRIPVGQQGQGHWVVVLHDQGEGDQQPKFRGRNSEVSQGANVVSQVQIPKRI